MPYLRKKERKKETNEVFEKCNRDKLKTLVSADCLNRHDGVKVL